jgi:hypothetical protein
MQYKARSALGDWSFAVAIMPGAVASAIAFVARDRAHADMRVVTAAPQESRQRGADPAYGLPPRDGGRSAVAPCA